jgi:hypothetical protein
VIAAYFQADRVCPSVADSAVASLNSPASRRFAMAYIKLCT